MLGSFYRMTQAKFISSVPLWIRSVLTKETPTVSGRGISIKEALSKERVGIG